MENYSKYIPGEYVRSENGHFLICQYCGESFYGRKNKRYCSLQCKNKKNNDKAAKFKTEISVFNKILINNYKILKDLYPESRGTDPIPIEKFHKRRFDFEAPVQKKKCKETGAITHMLFGYGYRYNNESKTIIIYFEI